MLSSTVKRYMRDLVKFYFGLLKIQVKFWIKFYFGLLKIQVKFWINLILAPADKAANNVVVV